MADKNAKSSKKSHKGVYAAHGGVARHDKRTAINCGCGKTINHSRANRKEHEREKQMAAIAVRRERGLSLQPRGRRGPANQPSRAALAAMMEKAARQIQPAA